MINGIAKKIFICVMLILVTSFIFGAEEK